MSAPSPTSPSDGLRFAFGTLTVFPVRVTRWDRPAARGGMLCAPLAGLVVGTAAAAAGLLLLLLGAGAPLAAVATVAVPAVLTRGLHLDGLADVADGLGSGKPAEPLADPGYRILAASIACALDGTPVPEELRTFQPTAYYPSTLHLLSLAMLAERYPRCM